MSLKSETEIVLNWFKINEMDTDRRIFLKRAALGLAALGAAAMAWGQPRRTQWTETGSAQNSSIFQPRRGDLVRHWREKLSRFRLR